MSINTNTKGFKSAPEGKPLGQSLPVVPADPQVAASAAPEMGPEAKLMLTISNFLIDDLLQDSYDLARVVNDPNKDNAGVRQIAEKQLAKVKDIAKDANSATAVIAVLLTRLAKANILLVTAQTKNGDAPTPQ